MARSDAALPHVYGRELRARIERRQKGMGVVMLILVGVLPTVYAIDLGLSSAAVGGIRTNDHAVSALLAQRLNAAVAAEPSVPKHDIPLERVPIAAGLSAEVKASSGDDEDEAIIND